jgi:hypothetical protein
MRRVPLFDVGVKRFNNVELIRVDHRHLFILFDVRDRRMFEKKKRSLQHNKERALGTFFENVSEEMLKGN